MRKFEQKVWLSSPTMHGDEQRFVKEAFDTNWVSTVGENLNQLEREVCAYMGCNYGVALSSGTAALHLALKLSGVTKGEKVFCSDLTFAATVNPVVYENCTPVFIDSEYDTWNMDPKALEKGFQIHPEVRVVVLVHLYGTPAKVTDILDICNRHNAILIEDAAESMGATYEGRQTGTFGKCNMISFNGNKIITCSGGGMLITDDKELADLARKWSTQSRENAPWYQHEDLGYNYRLSNVLAGIGRGQMLHLEEHIAAKKQIYSRYQEGLASLPIRMNPHLDNTEPNYWLSCLMIEKDAMCQQTREACTYTYTRETGKTCPEEIREFLASYNAESRPIWKPMHMQLIFQGMDYIAAEDGISVSEDIFARGLCLPSDIKMTKEDQEAIIEMVKACFQ